jgi:hypothetical protein
LDTAGAEERMIKADEYIIEGRLSMGKIQSKEKSDFITVIRLNRGMMQNVFVEPVAFVILNDLK